MSHYALARRALVASAAMALITFFQPAPADATSFSYDGFATGPGAYLAGDDSLGLNVLGGQNPANPFYAGGWIQSGGDAQAVFDVGSLTYGNLATTGGLVSDSVQFSCCSFGRNGRELADTLGADLAAQTIYQSFLIDFGTQGTDDPTQHGFRGYEMWNGGVGDSFLALRLFVNHFEGVNNLTLSIDTPSGTVSQLVNGGGTLAQIAGVHLMVLRFDFNPLLSDVVTLYMDPTDSIEANWAAAASVSAANSDLYISHHGTISNFTFSGGGHIPGRFDEVRWASTFAEVTPFGERGPTPVPEPTSLGLMGLGLLGAKIARRRRAAKRDE